MYINLPNNSYDSPLFAADANTTTSVFTEFGFGQLLATSIYGLGDGSIFGTFYDTNRPAELSNLAPAIASGSVGTSYLALDGTSTVNLKLPTPGQTDLDNLNPITIANSDSLEGFNNTWGLKLAYHFDGTLTSSGPTYTGGTFEVYFDDFSNNANDHQVLGGNLTGSALNVANLNLFFDITFAQSGFLFMESSPGSGYFVDAALLASTYGPNELVLDTNVDPPIPTADKLAVLWDANRNEYAGVRQARLDGSIAIPEPGTMALTGLGLLGLGFARRRKQVA